MQVAEVGLRQIVLETRRLQLAFARPACAPERMQAADRETEHDDVDRKLHEVPQRHPPVVVEPEPCERIERRAHAPVEARVQGGEDEERDGVDGRMSESPAAIERESQSERAQRPEEQTGTEGSRELVDERFEKGARLAFRQHRQVVIRELEEPECQHDHEPNAGVTQPNAGLRFS